MYYCFIAVSAVMFGLQFFFNRAFQKNEGNSIDSALIFSLLTSVGVAVIMFIINKGRIEFTAFSFAMALIASLIGIAFVYFSAFVFDRVNLSVYSLFSMLGGMILPAIYGIVFYSEDFSVRLVLCIVVIIVALFIGTDLKVDKKTIIYCSVVFVLNGLAGAVSKCHQSSEMATSSSNFMLIKSIITVLICIAVLMIKRMKFKLNSPIKSVCASMCYAFFTGIANFLVLVALIHVNASVQYPMITGGTIVVSLIISIVGREKVTYKNVISAALALAATMLIV